MIRRPPRSPLFPYTTLSRSVYGFARTTDDIGDRAPPDQRLGLLAGLEADLRRLYARDAGDGAGVEADRKRHTSELQSPCNLVCRLLLEKKKTADRCHPPQLA